MSKIRKILDVTGTSFNQLDFTESTIFVLCYRELPESVEIEVWGLSFSETQKKHEEYYVSGISTISFEGVTSGLLAVSIYQPDENVFVKFENDKNVKLSKRWGESLDYEEYQYHLGGVLDWPRGYCQLGFNATGKVRVSIETNDCVLSSDYAKNPEKFLYKEK